MAATAPMNGFNDTGKGTDWKKNGALFTALTLIVTTPGELPVSILLMSVVGIILVGDFLKRKAGWSDNEAWMGHGEDMATACIGGGFLGALAGCFGEFVTDNAIAAAETLQRLNLG